MPTVYVYGYEAEVRGSARSHHPRDADAQEIPRDDAAQEGMEVMTVTEEHAEEMADWLEHDLEDDDMVETRPGPGRPPLPPGEALDEVLTIRVTAAEKRRFQDTAEEHDRSQSGEGRLAILQHLDSV